MKVTSAVLGVSYLTHVPQARTDNDGTTDSHVDFLNLIVDNSSNCRLVERIVHFVIDFASKMACTICDMAKVVAINNAAKAKLYLIEEVRIA